MESPERVVIKLSRIKLILLSAGSFAFVVVGAWLLSLSAEQIESVRRFNNPVLVKGVGITCIGFFGLCGIWGIAKIFDPRPGLILDPSGITDNSSAVAAGLIPWNEVQGFAEFEYRGQKMLVILVKEPDKYISIGNPMRRSLNKANFEMVGSPISISSNSLRINYSRLIELCAEFYRRFGDDT